VVSDPVRPPQGSAGAAHRNSCEPEPGEGQLKSGLRHQRAAAGKIAHHKELQLAPESAAAGSSRRHLPRMGPRSRKAAAVPDLLCQGLFPPGPGTSAKGRTVQPSPAGPPSEGPPERPPRSRREITSAVFEAAQTRVSGLVGNVVEIEGIHSRRPHGGLECTHLGLGGNRDLARCAAHHPGAILGAGSGRRAGGPPGSAPWVPSTPSPAAPAAGLAPGFPSAGRRSRVV